jgi:hypothetical protein
MTLIDISQYWILLGSSEALSARCTNGGPMRKKA